jgi:thiamine biosynthesis lipoprotein
VDLWNIGHGGETVPAQHNIDEALAKVGYNSVNLNGSTLSILSDDISLDLGGSGKGYMLGRTVDMLGESGGYGLVSFGGNVGVYGDKPDGDVWKIAVRDPRDTAAIIGTISVRDGFVAVSGDYERYFIENGRRYCHIINPTTGWPVDNGVWSTAVYSENALYGDLLSTALFVLGREAGLEYCEENGVAALFVTAGVVCCSTAMAEIFSPAD